MLSLINRRQRQILVHSCLYYRFDVNLILDHEYDRLCRELAQLIVAHPATFEQSVFCKDFIGFDGSTGFDLPINRPDIINKARSLYNYRHSNAI